MKCHLTLHTVLLTGIMTLVPLAATADSGDVYQVTGERVNLRAGPSNDDAVRTTVERGDELIELQQDGDWYGVRVLETGDEGWIYADLIERTSRSDLARQSDQTSVGDLLPAFGNLLSQIEQTLGYSPVGRIERLENDTLHIMPTQQWLLRTDRDTQIMTALAFYQAWKAERGDTPVSVSLVTEQNDNYLTVRDEDSGPVFTLDE